MRGIIRMGCVAALAGLVASCGRAPPPVAPRDLAFGNTAAVRVSPAGSGKWLVLFETLQTQLLVTAPQRSAALIGEHGVEREFAAEKGWLLLDAVAHPSGEVTLLSVQSDLTAAYPLRVKVSRLGVSTSAGFELSRLVPQGSPEPAPDFMSSLDRARLVASGEDLFAVVRWANNAVQAYALAGSSLRQKWAASAEPAADLSESTGEVLAAHDAFFGESLSSLADPAAFDFGAAIVTRIDAAGTRAPATLLGLPGRSRRLLNLRVVGDSVLLLGRIKTGDQPGSWDGWILASGPGGYERTFDVQSGDMFWDAAPLGDGRIVAVGTTNYTQNPAGLSVSDVRDALALVIDARGNVQKRIALPAGPPNRGNEAISVGVGNGGGLAIAGVENAPGTHAVVFSDAFISVRTIDDL
jgi:hypothetical protein